MPPASCVLEGAVGVNSYSFLCSNAHAQRLIDVVAKKYVHTNAIQVLNFILLFSIGAEVELLTQEC